MSNETQISRRQFLRTAVGLTVGAAVAPVVVPSSLVGKSAQVPPSDQVVMGCIGVGWQGTSNMESFLREADVRIVAVCDVDEHHLRNARQIVDEHYGNTDCAVYHDFRDVLARADIDAVSLGLPDHWHAVPAIQAAEQGKDIYGEKPVSHTLREGRAIVEAVERYGRIWQTGSWQRSESQFRVAAELVRNGYIGKVHTVEVGLPAGHTDFAGTKGQDDIQPPPPELEYDFWLGPAPYSPYIKSRVHKNWRWYYDFGGGQLMDWVGHHVDIAHWGLGTEYTGPVEIKGTGEFPGDGVWDTATRYRVDTVYPNGVQLIMAGGHEEVCFGRMGTKWIGEDGWVWVDRSGIDAEPKRLLQETIRADAIQLYRSPGHWRNFIDCVKSRQQTITPCEVAHRSASPGHLGLISMLLGRKIRFNPETEEIPDDPTAARMLGKSMRSPWAV